MVASTRKRTAAADDQPTAQPTLKRVKAGSSPAAAGSSTPQARGLHGSPATTSGKRAGASVPKTGSRGAAFLAAAGIALPTADAPPKLSTKKESAVKARRQAAQEEAAAAKPASPRRNPLLQQELPRKLQALLDMFGGLQTVYEVMRKRGQRTTFQNMRQAVEEASGRRFLLTHVAQLKQLLPEALDVEWVKLPVAAHTSRTEAHLLITLNSEAAGEAAAIEGAAPRGGELQAARQLLHCRLAGHLLESYRGHLGSLAAEAWQAGDEAAAADLEAACTAAERPPVKQWVEPYPEGTADVPQQALPPRPDAPTPSSRAASPAVLGGAAAAAAAGAAQLGVPGTPATGLKPQATTAGRTGRPPVYPNTVERHRLQQRRLSFSNADPLATAAAAAAAAARPTASEQRRAAGSSTPLDKLSRHLDSSARQEREQQQEQGLQQNQQQQGKQQQQQAQQVHPAQAALAASLADAGEFEFGGAERLMSQEDADLLASMPEHLRRMSTDGIISLDTLRKLDAAEQQHRRLSSKEAVAAREANAALSQLPRTFSRLQRIFGYQGPNALKLRDVVLRIKQAAETTSEAQIEAQLRALAEHAPEYLTLKPYGACGTPALWVNRSTNANAVMAKLKEVAEGGSRRSSLAGM
ncbi:CDT1 chloroplastic [Chlorella sorokiniana]|uniref:CDT1 chloroplastic n=1 Tax=Chlorella sorokiniana TaxID=3076 RepID=A0A2P6TW19_CHLSO|nr:CDT1 chloroplastic [Chlorella sorokiniana]|eukprot:PRW58263.1 CDT1 chloroplastic [Chlorella sorokiniana]